MRRTRVLIALATLVATVCCGSVATGAVLPTGFTESTVWSGLGNPTVVRFAPDGRVFVASKSGIINVFDSLPTRRRRSSSTCAARSTTSGTAGCSGMALDPQFTTGRPYVYVLYAYDKAPDGSLQPRWGDTCPTPPGPTADGCVITGRLSRLRANGAETVLIEDWCQQYPSATRPARSSSARTASSTSPPVTAPRSTGPTTGQDGSPVNPCGDPRRRAPPPPPRAAPCARSPSAAPPASRSRSTARSCA